MKKRQAKQLLKLSDTCPECKNGKMEVAEGMTNIGTYFLKCNYFLRCNECGYEHDD